MGLRLETRRGAGSGRSNRSRVLPGFLAVFAMSARIDFQANRRRRLCHGGGRTVMAQLPTTAPTLGATPPAGKQAPGVYRHKLGDLGITQIADGSVTFPLQDGFVTNADKAAVNTALEAAFLPRDQVTIIFNPMVVNTG